MMNAKLAKSEAISFGVPLREMDGVVGRDPMSYFRRAGLAVIPRPRPASGTALRVRAYMLDVTRHWYAMREAQREAWKAYAETHLEGFEFRKNPFNPRATRAAHAYFQFAFVRRMLELALPSAPPETGPPAPVTDFEILNSPQDHVLSVRVEYAMGDPVQVAGMKLLVRHSRAMDEDERYPQQARMRFMGDATAKSMIDLPTSAGTLEMPLGGWTFERGKPYRLELTVVSPEGIPSLAAVRTVRWVKEEVMMTQVVAQGAVKRLTTGERKRSSIAQPEGPNY